VSDITAESLVITHICFCWRPAGARDCDTFLGAEFSGVTVGLDACSFQGIHTRRARGSHGARESRPGQEPTPLSAPAARVWRALALRPAARARESRKACVMVHAMSANGIARAGSQLLIMAVQTSNATRARLLLALHPECLEGCASVGSPFGLVTPANEIIAPRPAGYPASE